GNYATLFEDNYVAALLRVDPEAVPQALARRMALSEGEVLNGLATSASRYIKAKKMQRLERFAAFQIAGLELLITTTDDVGEHAKIVRDEAFRDYVPHGSVRQSAEDARRWLKHETFFTALRKRPKLIVLW